MYGKYNIYSSIYSKIIIEVYQLTENAKEKKEITYANQERIRIIYDPVDQCTYEISFTGKFKRIKKFIECMQPLLCPDNYLTDVDYNYIFSELEIKFYI